jgi:exodeoxyribonuclease VII small subunit
MSNKPANPELKPVEEMTFEACFEELERLLQRFEEGKMPLSESISFFERGMQLIGRCSSQLTEAEQKVNELLKKISPAAQNPDPENAP